MAAKTTLVEKLTEVGSERQLELYNLHAQNKLLSQLQSRVSESARQVHGTEASVSKASLRSTIITSDVAGFMLGTNSSVPRSTEGMDMTELSSSVTARRDGVSVETSNAERFPTGLNVSATPFPLLLRPVDQRPVTASGTSHNTSTQAAAYNTLPPPWVPPSTPVLSGSNLSMYSGTVPRNSVVMHTEVNQPLLNHTGNQVQTAGNATVTTERGCIEVASMSFQVPPVPKYTGNAEVEPFEERLEQFELVASVCCWEGRAKLANLVTRLHGQTYSFYCTCPVHQRTSYEALMAALTERFKPVRIKSVQSGLFHERKQKSKESVEEYAQDLNRLYQRAYPQSECRCRKDGTNCFDISGFKPEIRLKLAGHEGSFEQLLMKA